MKWSLSRTQARVGLAVVIGLAVILLLLFVRNELEYTDGHLGVPLDDAWIHFQFARNLSQGKGFSFNPGIPTPGSTAPLWTVILAGTGLISQEFLMQAVILSALLFLLTIGLTYGLTTQLSNKKAIGLVAAAGVMLSGRLIWAGLAGMETTAFAALSVAATWVYSRKGLNPAATALFGLASQARPEGHVLFGLAVADTVWTAAAEWRQKANHPTLSSIILSKLAIPVAIYLLVTLPYVVFSLGQTGRPLPNTFFAKVDTTELFSIRTLGETLLIHFRDNPVAFVLVIPGVIKTWGRSRLAVAWLILLPILSAFMVDFVWHHGRYTMPLIPFVMVVAAQGIEWLVERLPNETRSYATGGVVIALIVAGAWQLPRWARQLGQNSREIFAVDVAMGEWLARNTAPDSLIAVDDIGAIGFLSGRKIFDLNGLISPEMWPILHSEPQGHLRSEATTRLLSEVDPDYLAIFPTWHWEIASNPSVSQVLKTFRADSRTIIGDQEAIIYQTEWPYVQDVSVTERPVASLGEGVQLIDFEFGEPGPGQDDVTLTLLWKSQARIEESYDVFVHLVDSRGSIVAQADNRPVHNLAPTNRWQPGDVVRDRYRIDWSRDLPDGTYELLVGMYLRETGQRLPVWPRSAQDNAIPVASFEWQGADNG